MKTTKDVVVEMVMRGEESRFFSFFNQNRDFRFARVDINTETYECFSVNSTHYKPLRPSTVLNEYKTITEEDFLRYYKCVENLRSQKELREAAQALYERMFERD